MSMNQWMTRGVQILIVTLLLVYAADWIVTRVRIAHGTAFGEIQVHQLLATPLKGQKMEFDYDGDAAMTCSHSLFPQAGNPPCWWLARHNTQWE